MHKHGIRTLSQQRCRIGENPLWHAAEKRLYWCDIPRGQLYRYDPASGETQMLRDASGAGGAGSNDGSYLGGFTIQADGGLLLFLDEGRVERWDGVRGEPVAQLEGQAGMRFNDVIADPCGRVFCGTMSYPEAGERPGGLYRLDPDGQFTQMMDDVLCSNGMGFTGDRKEMFYTDSLRRVTYRFDYEQATGGLTNRRVWLQPSAEDGVPDGLTIDAEEHLWSAQWDGGCVLRYSPQGKEVERINFPTGKISSVAFGGEELDTLYVTSAGGGGCSDCEDPLAGALFGLKPGVKGRAEFLSRIGIRD